MAGTPSHDPERRRRALSARSSLVLTPEGWSPLPHLPRLQRPETLGRDVLRGERRRKIVKRLLNTLVGEAERAPVVAEPLLRAGVQKGAHGLFRVHVLRAHKPTWLVGPDRQ